MINIEKAQKFFEKNGYYVLQNLIPEEICELSYNYGILKSKAIDYKIFNEPENYDPKWDGRFGDISENSNIGTNSGYNCYSDLLGESLLLQCCYDISVITKKELVPTYSYLRMYHKDDTLKRHVDRVACKYSMSICLGKNTFNIKGDYSWPIYLKIKKKTVGIKLNVGDALIYKGCEIPHWRERFEGLNTLQLFLHYNDFQSDYCKRYDNREMLGIPNPNSQ
jgi:hypothetical protein